MKEARGSEVCRSTEACVRAIRRCRIGCLSCCRGRCRACQRFREEGRREVGGIRKKMTTETLASTSLDCRPAILRTVANFSSAQVIFPSWKRATTSNFETIYFNLLPNIVRISSHEKKASTSLLI